MILYRSIPIALLIAALFTACAATPKQASPSPSGIDPSWNDRLLSPVSQPTLFESPVVVSEIRPFALHQDLPESSVFGGGDFQLYAAQARFAVTDRLALIATKDGFIDLNPGGGGDERGWANLAAGVKFAAVENERAGLIVTPGLVFEADSGDHDVFQGNGDGILRPFVSAGLDRGKFNVLAAVGYNQAIDTDANSSSVDYHAHIDYEIAPNVYPLVEANGITYTDNGNALPVNFEGGDLINLGATDVRDQTVVTGAVGARFRVSPCAEFGGVYEFPLSGRRDLFDQRFMLDFIWRF